MTDNASPQPQEPAGDESLTPPPAAPAPGVRPMAPPYGAPSASAPHGAPLAPPPPAGYSQPAYPPPAYGAAPSPAQPPAAYGTPAGYGQGAPYRPAQPPYGYGGYPAIRTNPLAVTSLVSSLVGVVFGWTWVLGLGVIVGVITGHIALGQIKRTGEKGRGMAIAGVIVGWVAIGFAVLILVAFALFATIGGVSSGVLGS